MATAIVDGVFKYSKNIRNSMLNKNLGKYTQWLEELNPPIGEYYNIDENRPLYHLMDGKGILDYTHDGVSTYSQFINGRYFVKGRDKIMYVDKVLTPQQIQPWTEQTKDYIQYIDEVLGTDGVYRHIDYINNLLAGRFIENALQQSEVGVVRDPRVNLAMQGVVTTNINNMSGKDTKMGLISNQMYARSLYYGSIFNSDRQNTYIKIGGLQYSKTYLTPYLVNQYGNNQQNVNELADILSLGDREIRLREDLGENVKFNDFNDASNGGLMYLYDQIKGARNYFKQKYTPMDGMAYVTFTVKDGFVTSNNIVIENSNFGYNDIITILDKVQDISTYGVYSEGDVSGGGNGLRDYNDTTEVSGMKEITNENPQFEIYTNLNTDNTNSNSLISKTNKLFNEHKIATMIGRFHTTLNDSNGIIGEKEFTDTAKSKLYGNSHGRNLLKLDASLKTPEADENGYINPYCRTWTFHHQYNQMKDLIRPFVKEDDNGNIRFFKMEEIQSINDKYRSIYKNKKNKLFNGGKILAENTVLQDNGMVKITPTVEEALDDKKYIKRCMFSIENLAWKDVTDNKSNLSKEQRGPNGGRVMWFPPYDLDFQESVNVDWSPNEFIGRGEKVYTYKNTDRTGSLNFTILIDHPAVINSTKNMKGKGEEQDIQADILRFFAGCDIFDKDNSTGDTETTGDKGYTEIVEDKHIKISVFFPNDFSGLRSDDSGKNIKGIVDFNGYVEASGSTRDKMDFTGFNRDIETDYWWQYILVGNNTIIPKDEENFYGYEMCASGISDTTLSLNKDVMEKFIPACQNSIENVGKVFECKEKYSGCSIEGDNYFNYFKYHVDDDLHQILDNGEKRENIKESGYYDGTSNNLNAVIHEENDKEVYSFAEFIMALTYVYRRNYYDKYINFVLKCGARKDAIEFLIKIFKSKKVTYTKMTAHGGADCHDIENAPMLAERRARVIYKLLRDYIGDRVPEDFTIGNGEVGPTDFKNLSEDNIKNKLNRFCFFHIYYNDGEVKKLSDTGKEIKDEEGDSGSTTGITFDEYYSKITENSDILKKYGENTNIPFKKDMKTRFEDNDKTGFKIDDWGEVNKEIKDILDNDYKRDFVVLGYSVADEKTSPDFVTSARTIINRCDVAESSSETMKLYNDYEKLSDEYESLKRDRGAYVEAQENKIEDQQSLIKEIDTVEKVEQMDLSKLTEIRKKILELGDEIKKYKTKIDDVEDKIKKGDYENKIKEAYNKYLISASKAKESSEPEYIANLRKSIAENSKKIEEYREKMAKLGNEFSSKLNTTELANARLKVESITNEIDALNKPGNAELERDRQKKIRKKTKELENALEKVHKIEEKLKKERKKIEEDYKLILVDYKKLVSENKENQSLIDAYIKRNDIYLDDAINFFYAIGNASMDDYTSSGDGSFIYDKFPLRDNNKDDSGADRPIGADAGSYSLSFEKLFKHTLLIRYVESNYVDYSDDYYTLFSVIVGNSYLDKCENLLWIMKENHNDCCLKESGCTKEEIEKYVKAEEDLSKLFGEIINKYKEAKQNKEEEERKEDEKSQSQKISQNNKEESDKNSRDALNQIMRFDIDNMSKVENNRYENESEYFATLKENDPVIFKKLTDKYKYFNPAFHSMTPEGFNARLNFLHQCTRQGGTFEKTSKDNNNSSEYVTASNLAFGRMPVCVLRIGDFIHTKIIINSMSISYDSSSGIIWDLNPEGAGVQPMYAKVSLNITLIGGQSLEAPINKLQNAISFNYYANTEVYDNRADSAVYNGKGDIEYRHIWTPLNTPDEEIKDNTNNNSKSGEGKDNFNDNINTDENKKRLDNIVQQLREYFLDSVVCSDMNKTALSNENFANELFNNSYVESGRKGTMCVTDNDYVIHGGTVDGKDYETVVSELTSYGEPVTNYYILINSIYDESSTDKTTLTIVGNATIILKSKAEELYQKYKDNFFEPAVRQAKTYYDSNIRDKDIDKLMQVNDCNLYKKLYDLSFKECGDLVCIYDIEGFIRGADEDMKAAFYAYCSGDMNNLVLLKVPSQVEAGKTMYVVNLITNINNETKNSKELAKTYVKRFNENRKDISYIKNIDESLQKNKGATDSDIELVKKNCFVDNLFGEVGKYVTYDESKGIDTLITGERIIYAMKDLVDMNYIISIHGGGVEYFSNLSLFTYVGDSKDVAVAASAYRDKKSKTINKIEQNIKTDSKLKESVKSNSINYKNNVIIGEGNITNFCDNIKCGASVALTSIPKSIKDLTTVYIENDKFTFISYGVLKDL